MVSDRRGQLVLVAAILVAMTVLASVVFLNAVHIPADLKTGSLSEDVDRVQQLDASVRDDLDRAFVTVTDPSDSTLAGHRLPFVRNETAFESAINDSMKIRRSVTANQSGGLLSVEYRDSASVTGKAIFQTNDGAFTNKSGNSSWEAVTGASRLNLRATITSHTGNDNATLYVRDGNDPWTLDVSETHIYTSGSGLVCGPETVDFENGSVRVSVTRGHGTVWAETTDGTTRCGEFTFGDGVSTPWTVGFEGGDRINGSYGIAVKEGTLQLSGNQTHPVSEDSVLVNPAFNVTYVTDGITYQSSFGLYNETGR